MNSRRSAFVIAVISTFILSLPAYAEGVHGVMRVVKGDVRIKQASDGKEVKAKVGSKVYPKDSIVAGKDSRAKIVMIDNNEINISPDSEIKIDNYQYEPEQGKKNVLLNVVYGKVRAKVEQKYDDEKNKFQVKTPSAVAGVRGTDFFTSYDQSSRATSVVTFEGRVAFGLPGSNGAIRNPVYVTPGLTSTVANGAPPPPPVAVPKSELAKMDESSNAEGDHKDDKREPAESNKEKDKKDKEDKKEDGEKDKDAKKEAKNEDKKSDEKKSDEKKNDGDKNEARRDGNSDRSGKSPEGTASNSPTGGAAPAAGGLPSGDTAMMPNDDMGGSPGLPGSDTRAPASMGPAGGGLMLLPEDMASTSNPTVVPILPGTNLNLPAPPPIFVPPPCEFCNAVIENSRTKVNVDIKVGGP